MANYSLEDFKAAGQRAVAAGDIEAANQIAAQMEVEFPEDTARILSPAAEPEDLHGDMLESLTNIPSGVVESLSGYAEPERYTTEALPGQPETGNIVTGAANVLEPALGTLGPVASAGWDTWWNTFGRVLPENSKTTLEQGFKDATSGLMERWDAFSNDYPLEAAVLEDSGVVAEVLPAVRGPKSLMKTQRKQSDIAINKEIENRRQGLYKMLRTKDSEGTVEESSTVSGRRELWTPDERERNMATTLETIPDVDPNRSYRYNHSVVDKAISGWSKTLDKLLGKNHRVKVPKTDVLEEFDATFEDLPSIEGYHALSSDAQVQFAKLVQEARRLVEQGSKGNDLRPRDLYNIRKQFDNLFTGAGGQLETSTKNARSVAAVQLRNVLNDVLKGAVKDPDVHDLLDRQHEALKSKNILRDKRDVEASNSLQRVWDKLKEFGHLPSTPLALYATAATAGSLGAPVVGAAAAAGATGLAAYQTYKALKGPAKNKALAAILAQINKASKKDAKFADQIAPERALIIEMLRESTSEDATEE